MHLVGFIIRIYHDARSSECQTLIYFGTLLQVCSTTAKLNCSIIGRGYFSFLLRMVVTSVSTP